MAKLGCICGHTIRDQSDNLPYKADLIPDRKYLGLLDKLDEIISSLIEANQTGEKAAWIKSHFESPFYPRDLTDDQMVNDLFTSHYIDARKTAYQCEQCGRLWIQKGQSETFVPFKPEDDEWKDILAG